MLNSQINWFIGLFCLLQFVTLSVSAATCAAEANFQGCKTIQETALKTCGPVDYACQCKAQNLIRQCYDLCPEYSSDATIQSGVAAGICAAVPSSSSVALPSATLRPSNVVASVSPSVAASSSTPSASTPTNTSFAHHITPMTQCVFVVVFVVISVIV